MHVFGRKGNSFHTFQFYDEIDSILGTRELTQPTDVIESIQVIPEILQSTPEGLPPLLDNSILSEDGDTAETERSSSSASSQKSTSNSDLLEFIEKQDDKHEGNVIQATKNVLGTRGNDMGKRRRKKKEIRRRGRSKKKEIRRRGRTK
ncbi:hypothetical protein GQR58_024574 [Nymphon striatum]|nr:hypothetical protein GQR58_024574 [Nymphon striatum]